jgi:hypothetical protein
MEQMWMSNVRSNNESSCIDMNYDNLLYQE